MTEIKKEFKILDDNKISSNITKKELESLSLSYIID